MTKMTDITPSVPEKMLTIDGHEISSQMSFFSVTRFTLLSKTNQTIKENWTLLAAIYLL